MSGKDRIALFPSRANHVAMKGRIVSANKGLSLLKRKRDALELKLREIVALRAGLSKNFEELFSEAIFSIAKANFLETDFKPVLVIGSERADACMRLTYTKTIGLLLPTFEPAIRKPESLPLTGLSHGGKQVDVIRDKFQELLRAIILLASYDYSITTLQDAIRTNSMRLNGLEFVVIPRFNNTAAYIRDELDEMEREEFYRLKRSQGKQRALRDKGKKKPKTAEKYSGLSDAETQTFEDFSDVDNDEEDEEEEKDKFVLLPLSIFMKKRFASAAQTIISGHFPGSQEIISPTDSVVSGDMPTVKKRSSFEPVKTVDVKVKPSNNPVVPAALSTQPATPATMPNETLQSMPSESSNMIAPETPARVSATSAKSNKKVSLVEDDIKPDLPQNLPSYHSALDCEGALNGECVIQSSVSEYPPTSADETRPPSMSSNVPSSLTKLSDVVVPTAAERSPAESARLSSLDIGKSNLDSSIDTSSALLDVNKFNEPSTSKAPSTSMRIVSLHDMAAQTDITGRYPRRNEMRSQSWEEDPYAARSQANVPGRHGRGSNTEHGRTSGSEDDESS